MPRSLVTPADRLYLGIDLGTSGCRAIAIDCDGNVIAECALPFQPGKHDGYTHEQDPRHWWDITQKVLITLLNHVDADKVHSIAVDGTSGTLLLCDKQGKPCSVALMYNDERSTEQAAKIAAIAPQDSAAHGASSALAKLMYLQEQPDIARASKTSLKSTRHAQFQADWIAGQLCHRSDVSDENNCLKLGYDIVKREWPEWFSALNIDTSLLPQVLAPGTATGIIDNRMATALGLPNSTQILAGTTDGVAAFMATGANNIGDAVTSLGSTLVLKVLSDKPVFAPEYGVYSHRLGDRWLVGGASNCGGGTLLNYFSHKQLDSMSKRLNPDQSTGLDYYPLPDEGERFPVNDHNKQPCLTPRPEDDVVFYQGILEGIAKIEARGYQLLAELGAAPPTSIRTVGGGARIAGWTQIRSNFLNMAIKTARHQQAAFGTANLARMADKDLQSTSVASC